MKFFSFYKKRGPVALVLSVVVTVLLVVTAVEAATTISTNISTAGTLSVTGVSTLSGGIDSSGNLDIGTTTATAVTVGRGAITTNIGGALSVPNGTLTAGSGLTIGSGTKIEQAYEGFVFLDFPSVAANSCEDVDASLTGVATTNTIVGVALPESLVNASSTLIFSAWASGANTITVRLCQIGSEATINFPGASAWVNAWQYESPS